MIGAVFLCHCEKRNYVILTKEESHLLFIWAPISALRSRFFVRRCLLAKRAPLRSGRSDCLVERLVFQYESKKCKVGRLCAVGAISQSAQSLLSIHYSVNPKIFNEVVETVIIIGSISSTVHSFGFA